MNDLPMDVAELDGIPIDDTDATHARRGEVEQDRRTNATGSDHEYVAGQELLLALDSKAIVQEELSRIPGYLIRAETCNG